MRQLIVSIATRGRPERLVETVRRNLKNAKSPHTIICVALDDDDKASQAALSKLAAEIDPEGKQIVASVREREDTIAEKWNRAFKIPGDCYVAVGDDDPIATEGYDEKILEAASLFPDGIGMVYGHMANLSFSGVVAPTRRLCEKMGDKIFPEYFPYWFCDHWTDDLAKIIGRIVHADVRTDQSRPGKTQEMREPGWWATWFDAAYLMRRKQAFAIIDDPELQTADWQKKQLKTLAGFVEMRSRWINDNVRQTSGQLEGWYGRHDVDERYKRIKQRAVEMIPSLLNDYGMPANEVAMFSRILTPPTSIAGLKRAFA